MNSTNHDSLEARRQDLQRKLDSIKSSAERNRLGQFATPNALAIAIARDMQSVLAENLDSVRFADPSLGTGSFYSAVLSVFGSERIESAIGIEIDPQFSDVAGQLWSQSGLTVIPADFTRYVATDPGSLLPNLILANPPYVRHHHISREDKQRLQSLTHQMTGIEVSGLAGLYVHFLLLATAWLAEGGYAAWLIPSEFMDVNYGAALKRYLTDQVTLIRAHRFDASDVQFGDALVSSVILEFCKAKPAHGHSVEFTFGGALDNPNVRETVAVDSLRSSRKWTAFPRHKGNDRITHSSTNSPKLGDFFRIQRGIATGSNKFFVIDREMARRLSLPYQFLKPMLPSPRFLHSTVIEEDSDGYPRISPQLALIDCDLPEDVLKIQYQSLWEYLQTAKKSGILDGYLVGKRKPWYKQERREPAPFLCTYMGRGSEEKQPFRFIWNRSKAIGTNLYLMLYPKDCLVRILRDDPSSASQLFDLLTQITGRELRGEGRVYGGGLNKIEPSELSRISGAGLIERWPVLEASVVRQGELFA